MTYTIVGVYKCRTCQYNTGCRECWNRHRETCHGPRSIPPWRRRWTRAVVGDDIYLDLLDTIDPGDEG